MHARTFSSRIFAATNSNNFGGVEYNACGEIAIECNSVSFNRATLRCASARIFSGESPLFTPVISKNETTRNAAEPHASGKSSGTASISKTVVHPLSNNCFAPLTHDAANSV